MAAETRTIAEEWADNVRRMGREQVQQEMPHTATPRRAAPADERGMCRNASHTMKCAEAMMSPTMRASFVSMSIPPLTARPGGRPRRTTPRTGPGSSSRSPKLRKRLAMNVRRRPGSGRRRPPGGGAGTASARAG